MDKYNSRKEVPNKYKWDLTDFFKDDEDFNKNYEYAKNNIPKLNNYRGKLKDSNKMLEFINLDIKISKIVENLYVYAFLKNDEELGNKDSINRKNKTIDLYNDYSNATSYFTIEVLNMNKEEYNNLYTNKKLLDYKFMLDEIYKSKGHILSEEEENIINNLSSIIDFEDASSNLLNNEHDYGTIKINNKEEEIHSTNFRKLMQNSDENIRKEVFNKYKKILDQYADTSALFLNSYVKENNMISKMHNFKDAWDEKLYYLNMNQKAYDKLVYNTKNNYKIVQKYFKLIKDNNNIKNMHMYDTYLDLNKFKKEYSIEDAIELIRNALKPLGKEYINKFNKIIDNHYIDFCEYKGKCSGGYSASTIDHNSRILLSFNNDLDSVSTIIHECGHNIHHQFIMENNNEVYRNPSSLVCEIASLTNECLLSNYLIKYGSKEEKLAGISNLLNVIENNLFDCIREANMEKEFNDYLLSGNTITKDYMNKLDLESLKEFFGDIIFDKYSNTGWVRRSHYYMDYYLYSYAFCISVATMNAKMIFDGDKEQLNRYINFLKLGSDIYPYDAIKKLGFDLEKDDLYLDVIKYFDSLIDLYKKISKE